MEVVPSREAFLFRVFRVFRGFHLHTNSFVTAFAFTSSRGWLRWL
jgi:hypothetical protein